MRKRLCIGAIAAAAFFAGGASASTLDQVKQRGQLICASNTGLAGFAAPDASGEWSGFEVDICRAIAAAVLGDPAKVKFVPSTTETRFTVLTSGEVDVLIRNSTWTFSRDTSLAFDFVAVDYYDGQGFMVKKDIGIESLQDLNGSTICVQKGTTTELNLADYFNKSQMTYTPVVVGDDAEALRQYEAGACDATTNDASGLASTRALMTDPSAHIILPEIISKEPLGPVVRHGDNAWADIVRWTYYALLIAEEKGITKSNVDEILASTSDAEIKRLLGAEGDAGKMLGLDPKWAYNAIKSVGNYGEIFEAHLGESTPIGLKRGLNALWSKGGLQYAPPLR